MEQLIMKYFEAFLELLKPNLGPLVMQLRYHHQKMQFYISSTTVIKCKKSLFYKVTTQQVKSDDIIEHISLCNYKKGKSKLTSYSLEYSKAQSKWCCRNLTSRPKKFDFNFLALTYNLKITSSHEQIENLFMTSRFTYQNTFLEIAKNVSNSVQIFESEDNMEDNDVIAPQCRCRKNQCKVSVSAILDVVRSSQNNIFQEKCLALFDATNMAAFKKHLEQNMTNICLSGRKH